ncbi:MAG: ABC transporter permease [Candidatus Lokiarchaeota archaeon]|nr:ABC transporter permease [Candidatus Lokiarchaeota archaeon]
MEEHVTSKSLRKMRFLRFLKFYLIPGWRDPEFSAQEYQIEKITSKRRLFRHLIKPLTIVGIILILYISVLAIFAPVLTIYPLQDLVIPHVPDFPDVFAPPSAEHPLGTTYNGYDVLARIIWGARTTILSSLIPVTISIVGGLTIGIFSAYFGGVIDYLIMRFVDLFYAFPTLILIVIITPMVGSDLLTTLIIYGILFVPYNIRFMRSLVFQVKQLEYVQAAKVGGASRFIVMFKHILPNAVSPMLVSFFGGAAVAIIGLAGLAFIGFSDNSVASWGIDILWARGKYTNLSAAVWPGLFIAIAAIGFILVGDGFRDALDPRLKL